MSTPDETPDETPEETPTPLIPDTCPRCGLSTTNNVVIVTDPEGNRSTRCCTPSCGWRDDEPNRLPDQGDNDAS